MKSKFGLLLVLILALWGIQATTSRTITGKVKSAQNGSLLAGVQVAVKGTGISAITNTKGEYSVGIYGETATLVFTRSGYTMKEVAVGTRTSVDVSLSASPKDALAEMAEKDDRPMKGASKVKAGSQGAYQPTLAVREEQEPPYNTEEYDGI